MRKLALVFALLIFSSAAFAADESEEGGKNKSGLPLPRFASLRSNEINLRTGPGTRYPIDWVFVQQGLPVEITAEFDIWRRVRDWEGTEGWVHKTALTGKRMAMIVKTPHDLRSFDSAEAPVVAHLQPNAVGQIMSCGKEWCRIKFKGIKGFLKKTDFWGVYPNEVFD